MADQSKIPSVTMANTKKELLEVYEEAKKRLRDQGKDLLDAEKAKKRLEKQVAEATADSQVAQDPLQRLYDLRGAMSRELTGLSERFETEIETYRRIQTAVEEKKKELKGIFEVETAASDLAALMDAHRVQKQQFELEMQDKKAAFEEQTDEVHARWKREKSEHEHEIKEQADVVKKKRAREREEYEYDFIREKEQRKNDLEDDLKDLEKEIAQKQDEFEKEHEQRKTDLNAREAVVEKIEKEIEMLQKEVEAFPKQLETAIQKTKEDMTRSLTREFEKDKALLESKFEGEKNVLAGKIESLEAVVASQAAQIQDLSKSHEKAYEKVQDIANRAVAATKRETYSVPVQSTSVPLTKDGNQND